MSPHFMAAITSDVCLLCRHIVSCVIVSWWILAGSTSSLYLHHSVSKWLQINERNDRREETDEAKR